MAAVAARTSMGDVDRRKLLAATLRESGKDWARVTKSVQQHGDLAQGKKTLVHLMRGLLLSTQIATCGRIVDFAAANGFREMLFNVYELDWEYWDET